MSSEIWRPVPGFEGFYEVSDQGNIFSLRSNKNLKAVVLNTGRRAVTLYRNNPRVVRQVGVSRVVALAFLGDPPSEKPFALHRDGNALNDDLLNLYWGDSSENMLDAVRHGTHAQARKTQCPKGHDYSEENSKRTKHGKTCRACANESTRKARDKLKASPRNPETVPHGTNNGYSYYGCRCAECRDAHADHNRRYA